jgi:glucan phosphoethanolaminetransferase (alkaline phosphatase superfamily)
MPVGDHRINIAAIKMSFLITIVLVGIVPLCLYLIALLHPPAASAMGKHPGIVIAVIIVGTLLVAMAFHDVVIAPCRATTSPHTVTTNLNLGNPYTTEYKDSGEWCIWVRGTFPDD